MSCILGIESSCDETAAAVVDHERRVLSSIVATQHELHEPYAGVVPEIASRAHLERIGPVVHAALQQAGLTMDRLDAVAVGHRPGLVGSLLVGVAAAKALAWSLNIPLIGVDHVESHLTAALLHTHSNHADAEPFPGGEASGPPLIPYPALGLVVSGGHTTMYALQAADALQPLGRTIDDAIGECFDKVAVILGLGYPGGPIIDKLAELGNEQAHAFPRPTLSPDSLDFSFSGLKTSLLYAVRGQPVGRGKDATFTRDHNAFSNTQIADFAASFQAAAIDTVWIKLQRALEHMRQHHHPARAIVLGGGVSANRRLRQVVQTLGRKHGLSVHLPDMSYCVDNAAMIAGHAHLRLERNDFDNLHLPVIPTTRW
jgi:N6-L-threonylcarbamoyladenine synthase